MKILPYIFYSLMFFYFFIFTFKHYQSLGSSLYSSHYWLVVRHFTSHFLVCDWLFNLSFCIISHLASSKGLHSKREYLVSDVSTVPPSLWLFKRRSTPCTQRPTFTKWNTIVWRTQHWPNSSCALQDAYPTFMLDTRDKLFCKLRFFKPIWKANSRIKSTL